MHGNSHAGSGIRRVRSSINRPTGKPAAARCLFFRLFSGLVESRVRDGVKQDVPKTGSIPVTFAVVDQDYK
jgi:hypothetical protein